MMSIYSPLEQFTTIIFLPLYNGINFEFTNIYVVYLIIINIILYSIIKISMYKGSVVGNKYQLCLEYSYIIVNSIVYKQIGVRGMRYFPLYYWLFYMILSMNLVGVLPYSFTVTSQIISTLIITLGIIGGSFLLGLRNKALRFKNVFLHKGLNVVLVGIIFVLEVISYGIRALSLAIRLFANMVSGHALGHLLGKFVVIALGVKNALGIGVSLVILYAILFLEICIAVIQAYIFLVLTSTYIKDSLD